MRPSSDTSPSDPLVSVYLKILNHGLHARSKHIFKCISLFVQRLVSPLNNVSYVTLASLQSSVCWISVQSVRLNEYLDV